jgi:WhiB family redox-sensing transcriptional regulator
MQQARASDASSLRRVHVEAADMSIFDITIPEWMDGALCAQVDPELHHPAHKGASAKDAKRVCAVCPAIDACLAYALEHQIAGDVWGGLTYRERLRLAREAA